MLGLRTFIATLLILTGCSSVESDSTITIAPQLPITESSPAEPEVDETVDSLDPKPEAEEPGATVARIEPLLGSYRVEVVAVHPHDPDAYTQGLEWHDGALLESVGRFGESERRRVDLETGAVELAVPLDDEYFGEGLTVVDDVVLQLTWKAGVLHRSRVSDLSLVSTQGYSGEGWGLCFDGDHVVMSDGSSMLTRRDPESFEIVAQFEVTSNGTPVSLLNELECFGNQIVANVYGLDALAVIDGDTGIVVAVVDAGDLRPTGLASDDLDTVLNGVARHPETGHWLLTGKLWPVLYEVEFVAD